MMNIRTVGTNGRLALALVAVAAVAGACSGASDEQAAPAEPVGVASAGSDELAPAQYKPDPTGRVQLPLDAYKDKLTAATGGLTADAVQCFVDQGVDAAAVGVHVGVAEQHDRRYSVVEEAIAARYGYHAPETKDPRDALLDAADEKQLVAASDCLAELPAPNAEVVRGEQLVSDVQGKAWWAAQEDQRVIEAFAAWSDCMAEAGYDYAHPMAANDDPQWATPKATAAEVTVAKTDVACKKQVDLVATWSAVEAEHQAALISEHEADLKAYVRALNH